MTAPTVEESVLPVGDTPSSEPVSAAVWDTRVESGATSGEAVRRVAVTTLAEFACRQGDLDGGGVVGPSAREGQAAHQRFQSTSSADTEVRLMRRVRVDGELLELSGRVDLFDPDRNALGEIKTTLVPVHQLLNLLKLNY